MIKTHSSDDEKWIHSFAVTDVCLHPKKFTVYKITSVVFPINIPEALTCLTVWKRFNDIKALLKFIKKRHKAERIIGIVPTLNNHTFFKRFEADVITERKLFIIRLLDFVGQHPQFYKSQAFQDFFTTSQTMPAEDNLQFQTDDILCEDTVDMASHALIADMDGTPVPSTSSSFNESIESSSMSSPIIDSTDDINSVDGYSASTENEGNEDGNASRKSYFKARTLDNLSGEYSFRNPIDTPSEPNQRKDLTKFKVLKFIENVMQVQDVATKQTYIMKSIDKVFNEPEEFYLPTNFPFMVSLVAYYVSDTNIYLLLEQATGGRLYDYIRSYNRHSSNINKPVIKIPTIKFSKSFRAVSLRRSSTLDIPETQDKQSTKATKSTNIEDDDDDNFSFYDLLQSYYDDAPSKTIKSADFSDSSKQSYDEAPHFNLIANDLDVNNILNCSQKLLKSVSTTLKRVQRTSEDEPTLLNTDIINTINNSIESLNDSDENLNVTLPIHSDALNISDLIKAEEGHHIDCVDYLDVNQLPRAIIRRWFREIIFAVKHLHANDILCYDLQPNNLLLGKSGEILLTYFYRREFNPYIFDETMNHTCYPIAYIAPDRPMTAKSDVWSIGVIFFELLTGHSFQSCHPNGVLSYYDIQYPENVELDIDSKDLIEGMLQVDPIQRIKLDEIEEHPFFINI